MKRTGRGFTLIELLVVVAILALLIAILLPSLGKAKMVAMRTKCGTAIRGWGTAIATYQTEYSGMFAARLGSGLGAQWDQDPAAYGISTAPPNQPGIYTSQATGGTLNKKLRFCPADSPPQVGVAGGSYYSGVPLPSYKFAYYIPASGGTIPGGTGAGTRFFWKISEFKNHSEKMVMCDSSSKNNYGYFVSYIDSAAGGDGGSGPKMLNGRATASPEPAVTFSAKDEIQARHGGNGNVLFLDGHVDNVPWKIFTQNIPATANDTIAADPLAFTKNWTRISN